MRIDIDGPERYKCAVSKNSCPRCIVEQKNFAKPLVDCRRRTVEESMRCYSSETPNAMETKLNMRAVRNCFWKKLCVPISVYKLISSDPLHEFPHGIVLYILRDLKEAIARYKWDLATLNNFRSQLEKCGHFSAPGYVQVMKVKENESDEDVPLRVDVSKHVITVRKLEALMNSDKELKLVTGTSIISWMYMSTIVIGYGRTACLGSKGNDLHHFRIAMNCIYKLMKALETEEVAVTPEWELKVTKLVEVLLVVLADPHVYSGKPTEKMHRMLHLVENFKEHGCFKVSNTFHYEKSHQYFTKKMYNSVGKQSRHTDQGGPQLRMILQVLMNQLLSIATDEKHMEDDEGGYHPDGAKNESDVDKLANKIRNSSLHDEESKQEQNELLRRLKLIDKRRIDNEIAQAMEEIEESRAESALVDAQLKKGEGEPRADTLDYVGNKSSIVMQPLDKGKLARII